MSVWQENQNSPALCGKEGELVFVIVSLEPRDLEGALEALAEASFPINPEIFHAGPSKPMTTIEFPAYTGNLAEVRALLRQAQLDDAQIRVVGMIEEIHAIR